MTTMSHFHSFLYVPGDRADQVVKAFDSGADAILIDLEDAVAFSAKNIARNVAVETLRSRSGGGPAIWIRINSGTIGRRDVAALATEAAHVDGLVLSKCEDLDWLDEIDSAFPSSVPLSPLIESALGLRRIDSLSDHPRVTQCHLGEIDLLADLGAYGDAGVQLLAHAHAHLLYASTAAKILPPIGGVYPAIRDLGGFAADSIRLAQLGFAGRPALHPSQVPVINEVFRPSADELAKAVEIIALYDEALAPGEEP